MSIKKILGKILNIISPIILGTSIEFYSFSKIAIYVFVLSVIQIVITLFIKTEAKNEKNQNIILKILWNILIRINLRRFKNTVYQV